MSNEVGEPASTTNFTGVLLADVLKEVGVRRGADQVFTTSVDGWTCGTPTATLTDPARQAMLVIGMNGETLGSSTVSRFGCWSRALRVRVRNQVITDMELTTFAAQRAYWLQRGWGQRAPIKTMSRIDSPGAFGRVGEDSAITGVAWAQTKGIEKVEVRLDHGRGKPRSCPRRSTRTPGDVSTAGTVTPGAHVAEVRATNKTGYTQPRTRPPHSRRRERMAFRTVHRSS